MSEPSWRTSTVTSLCNAMRQEQNYSACPILADALEEAGYDDRHVLALLRHLSPVAAGPSLERLVAELYSEETAAAVAWIERYAGALGPGGYPGDLDELNYNTLMTAAHRFASGLDPGLGEGGSMNWSNAACEDDYQTFWKAFTTVTGRTGDSNPYSSFFSCDC